MANVQQFATWASIAAKIDTFPKLPSGGVDVFLTKAEILAKGGGLVKIEDGYSDNSFVALSDVSQYVVEWRYEFYFEPTEINLDYIGNAQNLRLVSTKQKFINNIAQGDPVKVGSSETVFDSWLSFVENTNTIFADMNGETPRSLNYTRTQDESGKTASCMVHQAAGVVSWEYELNITGGQTLNFAGNTSGSQEVRFESYKYKTVNGERTGERQWVSVETGYSSGDNYNSINRDRIGEGIFTISVQANGSLSSRSEVDYIRQAESGKEVYYTCNQEAGQEGWNYYFSGSPTSMSFGGTGGSQTVNVSSYRRRTVNGSEDGYQEHVNYLGSSNAWASVRGDTISVDKNDSTNQRALNVTYTQSGSGKSFSVSITQAAAEISERWIFGFEYDELEVYPLDGDYTQDVQVVCGTYYYINGRVDHFVQEAWTAYSSGEIFNYYTYQEFNNEYGLNGHGYVEIDYVYNEGDEGITNHMQGRVQVNTAKALQPIYLKVYF